MDSYKERNRGHSHHYNKHTLNNNQDSLNRDSSSTNRKNSSKSNSESPSSSKSPTQFTFECLVCLNTYPTKKDLTNHLYNAQHLRPLKISRYEPTEDVIAGSRKRKSHGFLCKMCHDDFSTYRELNDHIQDSGHFWSAKRAAKEMMERDSTPSVRRKSRGSGRRSSTSNDPKLDNSIGWQNQQDLFINPRDLKGKSSVSSLSVQSLSGSSDVVLDDSLVMSEKDIYVLDDNISNFTSERDDSPKSAEKQVQETYSVKLRTDNNQLDITSPDNSNLLQSKMPIETSTAESRMGLTVIPIEPHVQTTDPRQNFPCEKGTSGNRSKSLVAKWAPVYRDRPKPSVVEKLIPWKLIPIDLSPLNYSCTQPVLSNTSTHRVPSPAEDTLDASIDQLAAQLKENTGATFIPNSRLPTVVCEYPTSLDGNMVSCLNRDVISSNGTLFSSSDDRAALQSSTPIPDEDNSLEPDIVSQTLVNPEERSLSIQPKKSLIEKPSKSSLTSVLPCAQLHENASTCKAGISENPLLTSFVVPTPCTSAENPETADIELEIMRSLSLTLADSTQDSQSSVPKDCTTPEVLLSNTQNVDKTSPSSSVVNGKTPSPVAIIGYSIPAHEIDNIESQLSELFGETKAKNVNYLPPSSSSSLNAEMDSVTHSLPCSSSSNATENVSVTRSPSSCSTSPNADNVSDTHSSSSCSSSPEPNEQLIAVEEVVDSCSKCQTVFNIARLKVDLMTGNITIVCLKCGRPTVIQHGFKKMRL